jgi:hypothetical protein
MPNVYLLSVDLNLLPLRMVDFNLRPILNSVGGFLPMTAAEPVQGRFQLTPNIALCRANFNLH